jgi:hypothetical protein
MGINVGLGGVVAAELVAVALIAAKPAPTLVNPTIPPSFTPVTPAEEPSAEPIQPLASSVSRPLFQRDTSQSVPQQSPAASSAKATALASRLSLIGIVAGNPAQAIIEDSQTNKTYFVSAGQGVIEGLIVEDVGADRVLLDLNGEPIELSL